MEKRKQDPNLTQNSFHLWLTLARLHAISLGEDDLSMTVWNHMLALESQRNLRFVSNVPN